MNLEIAFPVARFILPIISLNRGRFVFLVSCAFVGLVDVSFMNAAHAAVIVCLGVEWRTPLLCGLEC